MRSGAVFFNGQIYRRARIKRSIGSWGTLEAAGSSRKKVGIGAFAKLVKGGKSGAFMPDDFYLLRRKQGR